MIKSVQIAISPEFSVDIKQLKKALASACAVKMSDITYYRILKRSIDARRRDVLINLKVDVFINEPTINEVVFEPELKDVTGKPEVLIVGAGPAGLFAGLRLISLGFRPVIIERGKDVRSRRRDLAAMNKQGITNPESNYCFGEGGAGTYSDGKLYTRSTKRGDVNRILNLFVHFGADADILVDAHPHIGTNKLPQIITAMREAIVSAGGAVHFDTKLTDIVLKAGAVAQVITSTGQVFDTGKVILATGHSARDIFELLHRKNILIEAKPFALGVRVEHPQTLVDQAQYHCSVRSEYLPPASYSLVTQQQGRGVFSFCMCPGGIIAPAATNQDEIVVNGWSPSKRNNPFANSGTVVSVDEADFRKYGFNGPLAAMRFQEMVERQCFVAGGGRLVAPAQRLVDFHRGVQSATLPECSYLPGITSVAMDEVLPVEVAAPLRLALADFGKKMKGYYTNDALLVATESRTSSPVRIPRDKDSLEHPQVKGLFPCGEGAGYAGGIVSAAIDGERCAMAAVASLQNH